MGNNTKAYCTDTTQSVTYAGFREATGFLDKHIEVTSSDNWSSKMKQETISVELLRTLLLMSCLTLGVSKKCARFKFPTLEEDDVITAMENTTVSVPFELGETFCHIPDTFTISISRQHTDNEIRADYCKYHRWNGTCDSTASECTCPDVQGRYHFTKTVNRRDSTTWTWGTISDFAHTRQLTFDITYPASITQLSLPGEPHDPGDRVDVVCTWENGNPPVTARLLDRLGNILNDGMESGQIRHTLSRVRCEDAGLIRCEAPGASHNETVSLLVKCPPKLVGTPTFDEGGSLKVGVRSHTKTIQACKLTRPHPHDAEAGKPIDCTGSSTLTGTPPDLTLTVRLDNVGKEEEGQWRLELTNDVGTGHVELKPTDVHTDSGHVHGKSYEETNTDETSSGSSPNSGVNVPLMGGVIVGVNVGTVIIVTIIVLIIVRRSRRERQPEPVEEQEMVPPPIPPPRQDPEANRLAELARRSVYDDIFADLPQGYNRQNHPLPPCPDQPPPRPPRN